MKRSGSSAFRMAALALLLLGLGAATSVAVAWGIALFGDGDHSYGGPIRLNGWAGRYEGSIGYDWLNVYSDEHGRWEARAFVLPNPTDSDRLQLPSWSVTNEPPMSKGSWLREYASGWPLRCLRLDMYSDQADESWIAGMAAAQLVFEPILICTEHYPTIGCDSRGALVGRNPLTDLTKNAINARILPIGPIWLGLAGDSLLYSGLWLILVSPILIVNGKRRSHRAAHGECMNCGYSLRGVDRPRCSECGWVLDLKPPLVGRSVILCLAVIGLFAAFLLGGFGMLFVEDHPYAPIHLAAFDGDDHEVERLIADDVDVDEPVAASSAPRGATAMHIAAGSGHTEIVRKLIDAGAELDNIVSPGATPLGYAIMAGDISTVRLLVDSGATLEALSSSQMSPLTLAAMHGDVSIVRMLHEAGAAINVKGARTTPLEMAVLSGNLAVAEYLLEHRAEITYSTMYLALKDYTFATLHLLERYGADFQLRSDEGETLLFGLDDDPAARPVWEFVVRKGIDVNAQNENVETALMWAARYNNRNVVQFLLGSGADPSMKNDAGEQAVEMTSSDDIATILLNAMKEQAASSPD